MRDQIQELRVQIHELRVQIQGFENDEINKNSSKQPSIFYWKLKK